MSPLHIIGKIFSPLIAFTVATIMSVGLGPGSFVGDAISDFCYRWPKWYRVVFWSFWKPGAFYYQWRYEAGGAGPARWFWRKPKHPRWKGCGDWWVFKG